jgi:hypothetical protein
MARRLILKEGGLTGSVPSGYKALGFDYSGSISILYGQTISYVGGGAGGTGSGTSGVNGTSGTSGVNGSNGASGVNGTSGTSGISISGTSGVNGATGSNGTSGTSGISGSSGTSGGNGATGSNETSGTSGNSGGYLNITQLLDNVAATTTYTGQSIITDWTTTYTSVSGSSLMFNFSFSAFTTSGGASRKFDLLVDSVVVASTTFYFNQNNVHTTIPCLFNVESLSAGSHTIQLRIPTGTIVDSGDSAHLTVIETMSNGVNGTSGTSGNTGTSGTSGVNGANGTSGTSGNPITAGYVNAGTFVTLDNIKASVTTTGNRGLSIAAVSSTFSANISGMFGYTGGGGGASANSQTYTTTASGSIFNWGFPSIGDGSQYIINDTTNSRVYRITLMIGSGYNNNFISIERLY